MSPLVEDEVSLGLRALVQRVATGSSLDPGSIEWLRARMAPDLALKDARVTAGRRDERG